ncbi:MAG TPA: single-stranded DNA-binding protein [Fimbriimonadales bacterium]|nr:single-stranded DNA-binding protein [Fimbriimonadales bacterium]
MASINRVVLTGRLTQDPELQTTASGKPLVRFTLAVQKRIKPADPNQKDANFIRCIAWNQSAEFLANYAQKGRMIAVDGRLDQRRYVGNDGVNREVIEVVADNVALLDRPRDGTEGVAVVEPEEAMAGVPSTGGIEPEEYDPFAEE